MKRVIFVFAVLLLTQIQIFAQNDVDALRYSSLVFGGSARYVGLAGAFGAVGADFSTLSSNPAGLGLYKTSEFLISPSLYIGKTTSEYNGMNADDMKYNFNLGNIGIILAGPAGPAAKNAGWQNFQFGIGLNRTNNFNNRMLVEGNNYSSSILDTWKQYANGNIADNLNSFDTRLAYDTWLLDIDSLNPDYSHYKTAVPAGGVMQRKSMTSWGSMNEWVISVGANYDDKLYLGATVGFPFLRYFEQSTYSETALADSLPFDKFRQMNINNDLQTNGSGVNFKFGLIFQPVDFIRLGAALHTPTYFYNMHDSYSTTVNSAFDNGDKYTSSSPDGTFDYKLTTPMRVIGSVAFLIGKMGLVSADYELVDYSEARLRSSHAEDFFSANDSIRSKYTAAGNLRVGTEWRFNQFSIRGGYASYGSPFKSGINDAAQTMYTFGLGIRQQDYFLDFTYEYTSSKEDYYLYDSNLAPLNPVKNKLVSQNFILTLGCKF